VKRFLAFAMALAAYGCGGGKDAKAPPPSGLVVQPLASDASAPHAAPAGPSVARSHLVGTIAGKAIGPFIGRSSSGGLVAWIGPAEHGTGQELAVVPIAQDGAPFGQPRVAATVPSEATSLIVRPSGTAHGGWLIAWSALLDRGESVSVLGVGSDGSSQKAAFDVTRTTDHVKWIDIVPLPTGGLCVWAEETTAGDANILAAPLDSDGKARGLPVRVARGMLGWAVARDGDGVVMALVRPGAEGASSPGALMWLRVDGDGHARGAPLPIGTKPTVSGDVDLVTVPGGWLLGWTDRTSEDAQVTLATVDASGKITGPRHAMDAVGGASLVGLASGPAGVALAWTEPRGRARTMRALHLAGVSLEGPAAQPVMSVDIATGPTPELVATESGFALLSTARACTSDGGANCDDELVPSVIRFDGRLVPAQTEPLFVGDRRTPATLGWNLACLGDRCTALAADAASPTGVFAVDLAARSSPFRAPVTPPLPVDAPRVVGVVTVASGQPFADLATVRVGDATLVATLTTALEAVDEHSRGKHAQAAVVAVRAFDGDGQPLAPPSTITSRALPVGGVAIAPGGKLDDGVALAWVARDDGDPQVHVAHLDKHGRRTNEVQLTTAKGDASDVAIAWAGDGWMVAWVDARNGNGEVYATKVDRDLQRTAHEERITKAPGDAGDVALAVRGDVAWLAWSDPRESPREGLADIYATTLHASDARRAGDEVRVLSTASHSRSPVLAIAGEGTFVGWIEDAPQSLDARGTAVVARLDASAHVIGAAAPLPLADAGNPAALVLVPDGDGARAFIARSHREDVSLDAVALRADGTPVLPAWRLLDLDAPASFDVALAAAGDAVYFDDIGLTPADHRVRRAAIVWRR
jgi:hypothetical protein